MSVPAEISEEVRGILDRHIESLEHLEVLLLLMRHPERRWTGRSVGTELRIASESAGRHLAKLCAFNLLQVEIGRDLFYWFSPSLPHLTQAAQALAAAYAENRLGVIKHILGRPSKPVRDFADAFRLTKKDDSDA